MRSVRLLLAQLLHLAGIDAIILEARSKEYVLGRIRAGVIEQGVVDMLDRAGVGSRAAATALTENYVGLPY